MQNKLEMQSKIGERRRESWRSHRIGRRWLLLTILTFF
jgi:hypothetical protein